MNGEDSAAVGRTTTPAGASGERGSFEVMADVTVEAVHLSKTYGSRTAVHQLSFEARRGEVVGLLGPNGAGKTTTIRLLTTLTPPTAGAFSVAGIAGSRPAEVRRRIGVLPESAGYPGHQTAAGYLHYHARLFGLGRDQAAGVTRRLLAEVGLSDRASSRISTYSRGMRQRLGIARALVNDPAVIFLDEPTLGLDPAGQQQVLNLVRDIAVGRQSTIVLSSHTLPDVEKVCSRVLIISGGRLLISGSPGEVTRAAGGPRTALLRVPAGAVERARTAVADVPWLRVSKADEPPDGLRVSVAAGGAGRSATSHADLNGALRAVLDADVPVLSFELEGTRLSDAFLALTSDGRAAS